MKRLRVLGALAVLAAVVGFAISLTPHYLHNFQFQRHLEQIANDPVYLTRSPEVVRVNVAEHASRLGLPVGPDQINVRPGEGRTRIEVRYFVRVDLPMYTVDLHFRPSAGGR